jgi:Domain of unknown function (DUF5071)
MKSTTSPLVPTHKSDWAAIDNLKKASSSQIIDVAGDLLTWIQDGNWPVARGIRDVLTLYTNQIKNDLIKVLRGDDDVWKRWCITMIIDMTQGPKVDKEILKELERIAEFPTNGEVEDGVSEMAAAVLADWKDK